MMALNNTALDVGNLPLTVVRQRCQEETAHFLQKKPHDPRYGYELFRRASAGDELAWECIYHQYSSLVSNWLERNPALIYSGEEVQYLVNRAFERMWRCLTPESFARFTELRQLLRYLELCANSCLLDYNRKKKGQLESSLDDLERDHPAHQAAVDTEGMAEGQQAELWQVLGHLVTDEVERVVLVASFILNLKPQQIQSVYTEHFPTVSEVYRTKQNILQRLRRSPQLQQFVLS